MTTAPAPAASVISPAPPPVPPTAAQANGAAAAAPEAPALPTFAPLPPRRFKLIRAAENPDLGNLFAAVLPAGTPFEFALRPTFWANVAHMIAHRGDGKYSVGTGHQIEIHTDDVRFYGRLYVLRAVGTGTNHTSVDVAKLEYHEFDPVARPAVPIPHVIEPRGPHLKYCVIRTSDGQIISQGHESEDDARRVMRSLARRDS